MPLNEGCRQRNRRARLPAALLCFSCLVATAAGCGQRESAAPAPLASSAPTPVPKSVPSTALAGSQSCRDCHADFYKLWADSWHGLAMQPYTATFAKAHLTPQTADIVVGKRRYRAEIGAGEGCIRETGPSGVRTYPIAHVMGGKNIYYFLTPLDRGRLQVLPVAYDVHKKAWYDMAASGVRHFPDRRDEALDWTDRMYAFNTTCFNCHVTELATNYDLATDTYHTTWTEPGISCEACHGLAQQHVRAMEAAAAGAKGTVPFSLARKSGQSPKGGPTPKDLKIIRPQSLAPARLNDLCATCHAKLIPLSLRFVPGDDFFDHFDLITFEHIDFYPDGRDLGENYTYTLWRSSPCVQSGKLDCNHCHTPSGRMRYTGEKSNQMCMPCHAKEVGRPAEHGHHIVGSKGNDCVGCHMPMTRFAAMGRTDHSMRPPTPAVTIALKSPNACNLCHSDQTAAWADQWVRQWYPSGYQADVLRRAELIDQARRCEWKRLPEILAELKNPHRDEVNKTSLVRLLGCCDDDRKWPVLLGLLGDPSPLVRSSAASALGGHLTPQTIDALLTAAADPSRLVRIRVAMALAGLQPQLLARPSDRTALDGANRDFMLAMQARPDDWASHANLGNFYLDNHDFTAAVACFETAMRLEPRQIGPLVSASLAYHNLGRTKTAEESLRRALKLDPTNAAAHFNLGLLMGECGKLEEAEQALRAAVKADPQMAPAVYNLGVIVSRKNLDEAIAWCSKAYRLRPRDPKYAYTLATYERRKGRVDAAVELLQKTIKNSPSYIDAYLLLGVIYEKRRDSAAAAKVYRDALKIDDLPPDLRAELEARARLLESGRSGK
jgi:tetratricopeptide (TPR) repeat protein